MTFEEAVAICSEGKDTDIMNEVNPVPWKQWLGSNCKMINSGLDVQHWNSSNCHYIVYKGYVFTAFGYHGFVVFDNIVKGGDDYIIQQGEKHQEILSLVYG